MIKLTRDEFNKLERIQFAGGFFGSLYKVDDKTAYKIYYGTVRNIIGLPMNNPTLSTNILHYKLLLSRKDKIKKSHLPEDLVYVDKKFKGVKLNYLNGEKLSNIHNLSYDKRLNISYSILDKGKELTKHLIYHTDFKTNNMLLDGDTVHIIDLDDVKTHAFIIPSILFRTFSITSLGNVIQDVMGLYDHELLRDNLHEELKREKSFRAKTYKRIEEYLEERQIERDIFYIDKNTDINELKNNTKVLDKDIVYLFEPDERPKTKQIFDNLKLYNIPLYDFVLSLNQNKYKEIENIRNAYQYENNEFKLVYKKY